LNQNFKTPDFVDYSREIDKRDGFPVELLHARYVIVASPIHTVFDPAEQQIVMVPEEEFLEGSGIAGAFDKLPYQFNLDAGVEYTMDGGVKVNDHGGATVYIFRKVRNITMQEVEQLSESLRLVHPDRPYIYNPPAIIN